MNDVHVAVGVILDAQNRILITRRHDDAHQGGLWEFPGGKVETGETVEFALARELREELGIVLGEIAPLVLVEHDYGDKSVRLDVHTVRNFSGEAEGLEGQPLMWVSVEELAEYQFPAANLPILKAIPEFMAADNR
ncbi:MAG: 8-oxo-dGTP diphosphatase MutT [Halieaceae bacterium]